MTKRFWPRSPKVGRPRGGASVPCPRCGKPSRVSDTRRAGHLVHRQRVCSGGHRFDTSERCVNLSPRRAP